MTSVKHAARNIAEIIENLISPPSLSNPLWRELLVQAVE